MDSRRRYTGFPGRWMKTFFTAYFCGLLKVVVAAAADVPEMPSFIRHKFSLIPPEGCVLRSLRTEFRLESSPQSLFHKMSIWFPLQCDTIYPPDFSGILNK